MARDLCIQRSRWELLYRYVRNLKRLLEGLCRTAGDSRREQEKECRVRNDLPRHLHVVLCVLCASASKKDGPCLLPAATRGGSPAHRHPSRCTPCLPAAANPY